MTIREKYAQALSNLPDGVLEAEAEGRREVILSISVSNEEITSSKSSDVTTVSVLAQSVNGAGYAFTQNMEEPPEDVFLRAYEGSIAAKSGNAELGDGESYIKLSEKELPDVKTAVEAAAKMEKWALEADTAHVVQAEVTVSAYETAGWVVNTKGLNREVSSVWYDCTAELVLDIDGKTCNSTWCTSKSSLDEISNAREDMQRSIRRAVMSKGEPVGFTSGQYRAILSREALCQMLVCMWQPFSAFRQMNGRSCVSGLMGRKIASDALNISDACELDRCGYSRIMDTEGTTGTGTMLITNGVLTGRLHNLKSARYYSETPSGNSARSEGFFSGLPTGNTAAPNITYIVPGNMKEEDMLSRLGNGVWITETYDPFHSIEPTSGDFAIPCNGVLIKDGKPAGILNSLTITGNLLDLWQSVEAVGDTNLFWRFYTGLYYLGGADILVKQIQING